MTLQQHYTKLLEGLEDDTYKSLAIAAQANDLSKSSPGRRKNGWQPRQEACEEQQISRGGREGDGEVVLKLDDFGFKPRVDILMG